MAALYNITINQYSDFSRTFEIKKDSVILDLTDHSFAGSLKQNYHSASSVDFTAQVTDASLGLMQLTLTDTQTADMTPGDWVYDVVMTDPNGLKTRLFQGQAFVEQGVTD